MTIDEAQQCKRIAENGITDIINAYERISGLQVQSISLQTNVPWSFNSNAVMEVKL